MNSAWATNYNLQIFNEIDSTNSEAKRVAASGPLSNFVIVARNQTAGRGRYGRKWESPNGNIYMSIILQSTDFAESQAELSFVSALSIFDAIESLSQKQNLALEMALKWPNDVLVSGKKIAGVLLESVKVEGKSYLVIGIGINLESNPDLPDRPTTSLKSLGISYESSEHVLDLLMTSFEKYVGLWHEGFGFKMIRELWLKKAYKLGEVITVNDNRRRVSGIFENMEADGSIRLRMASGEACSMSAGEIFFGNEI